MHCVRAISQRSVGLGYRQDSVNLIFPVRKYLAVWMSKSLCFQTLKSNAVIADSKKYLKTPSDLLSWTDLNCGKLAKYQLEALIRFYSKETCQECTWLLQSSGESSRLAGFRVAKLTLILQFIAAQLQQGAGAQKTDGKNNKGEPQVCRSFCTVHLRARCKSATYVIMSLYHPKTGVFCNDSYAIAGKHTSLNVHPQKALLAYSGNPDRSPLGGIGIKNESLNTFDKKSTDLHLSMEV
jgi:hypothetical protein